MPSFPVIYRIVCDLCGLFADGMFDSEEEAKKAAIQIGWLDEMPNNGHKLADTDHSICENCGVWNVFWPARPCVFWIVACPTCRNAREEF